MSSTPPTPPTPSSPLLIGYVPEHFSSPLLSLSQSHATFTSATPHYRLISCPSGTGQMITMLRNGQLDVAFALTEALVAGIAKKTVPESDPLASQTSNDNGDRDPGYKLAGTYVTTPLDWGVIVGNREGEGKKYEKLEDLKGEKFGISRIGSGSQVMVSYLALQQKWFKEVTGSDPNNKPEVAPLDFVLQDTFENLRKGVNNGTTAAFMWEHFTTKPFVDNGEVRFISHIFTPWPSWQIAASTSLFSTTPDDITSAKLQSLTYLLHHLLPPQLKIFNSLESRKPKDGMLENYVIDWLGYDRNDVEKWIQQVAWPDGTNSRLGKKGREEDGTKVRNVWEVSEVDVGKTLEILTLAGALKPPKEGKWNIERDFVETKVAKLIP